MFAFLRCVFSWASCAVGVWCHRTAVQKQDCPGPVNALHIALMHRRVSQYSITAGPVSRTDVTPCQCDAAAPELCLA